MESELKVYSVLCAIFVLATFYKFEIIPKYKVRKRGGGSAGSTGLPPSSFLALPSPPPPAPRSAPLPPVFLSPTQESLPVSFPLPASSFCSRRRASVS